MEEPIASRVSSTPIINGYSNTNKETLNNSTNTIISEKIHENGGNSLNNLPGPNCNIKRYYNSKTTVQGCMNGNILMTSSFSNGSLANGKMSILSNNIDLENNDCQNVHNTKSILPLTSTHQAKNCKFLKLFRKFILTKAKLILNQFYFYYLKLSRYIFWHQLWLF